MGKWTGGLLIAVLVLSVLASGCYYREAKKEMRTAEQVASTLKAQGGERLVPYEYTSAEMFLKLSKEEFAENDFKAAKEFATRSKAAGEAGLTEIKKK